MSWTAVTRGEYLRSGLRYASDLTEAEWAIIAPLLEGANRRGRPRTTNLRAVWEALLYMVWAGCQWRALPKDFPPRSTVQRYFYRWRDQGLWPQLNRLLVSRARRAEGRSEAPSAVVIDSQSARTSESGGPRGFDAAKRVKGRKRHIVTDTGGRLLAVQSQPANVQDNHGAVPLLRAISAEFPNVRHAYADRVYRGRKLLDALADVGPWTIEIITRTQSVGTFVAEPRRWVVERTFAWLNRNRRLSKDFEASIESQEAWINLASIKLLIRSLARRQQN